MASKNPFAGYKEGKESMREERKETKGLQRFEKKRGMEKKHAGKSGKKC